MGRAEAVRPSRRRVPGVVVAAVVVAVLALVASVVYVTIRWRGHDSGFRGKAMVPADLPGASAAVSGPPRQARTRN